MSPVRACDGFIFPAVLAIRMSERLNSFGAAHWGEVATQNYFDRNGEMGLRAPVSHSNLT